MRVTEVTSLGGDPSSSSAFCSGVSPDLCPPPLSPVPGDAFWDRLLAFLGFLRHALLAKMQVDAGMQLAVSLFVMFTGALLAGALPWFIKVKDSQLKTVAALGGGLLIGTSLAVVIPEGFHALAEASDGHGSHTTHTHTPLHEEPHSHSSGAEGLAGLVLVGGFLAMLVLDHLQHAAGDVHLPHDSSGSGSGGSGSGSGGHVHGPGCSHGHAHSHGHSHSAPGLLGELPPGQNGSGSGGELVFESADLEQHRLLREREWEQQQGATGGSGGGGGGAPSRKAAGSTPQRAITGLMIHCVADGLAMGAAALSGDLRLSMMIAVAMCVHKAPMAFGLATYLMNHRWSWARAQGTMVMFSAMAPLGAVATYLLLGHIPLFTSTSSIALIVLFSGGTFLYAATMHILPEVLGAGCHLSLHQIGAVTLGGLLPALLSYGHEH